jgi:hypothetical protein
LGGHSAEAARIDPSSSSKISNTGVGLIIVLLCVRLAERADTE